MVQVCWQNKESAESGKTKAGLVEKLVVHQPSLIMFIESSLMTESSRVLTDD